MRQTYPAYTVFFASITHWALRNWSAVVGLLLCFVASTCMADELLRLAVDFNGNGKSESVSVSTSAAKQKWRRTFTVTIRGSKFSGEYLAAEGDVPQVRVIAPDDVRKHRLLLIETPEASWCNYYVLGYTSRTLVPLLVLENGTECNPPQPIGRGRFRVSTWQGFWSRDDTYQPSDNDQHLKLVSQPFYLLRVAGAATAGLLLEGAECKSMNVPENTFVSITGFDPKLDRYRVESARVSRILCKRGFLLLRHPVLELDGKPV